MARRFLLVLGLLFACDPALLYKIVSSHPLNLALVLVPLHLGEDLDDGLAVGTISDCP